MDASAIKEIVNLAVEATRARILPAGVAGVTGVIPAALIGEKIISLEGLESGRARFRGTYSTNVLSEFVAYVVAHPGGTGFIDADNCTARVLHNLGTKDEPGHGDWASMLRLKPTAGYAAVLAVCKAQMDQKKLIEFVEDWSPNLDAHGGIAAALAAIRNVTIAQKKDVTHTDKDFGASRSALEEIEAKASGGMPSHFTFHTEPYAGFAAREFKLRLSVLTSGPAPAFVLRTVAAEQIEESIATEFKTILLREIDKAATLSIGTFAL